MDFETEILILGVKHLKSVEFQTIVRVRRRRVKIVARYLESGLVCCCNFDSKLISLAGREAIGEVPLEIIVDSEEVFVSPVDTDRLATGIQLF